MMMIIIIIIIIMIIIIIIWQWVCVMRVKEFDVIEKNIDK